MAEEFKRQIAYKTNIDQLIRGVFVKKEGWESSLLLTEYGTFSRINIIAVVVGKEEHGQGITIDDRSGLINCRVFEGTLLEGVNVGDLVLVVGRIREYGGNRYIALEIVKKIQNKGWIAYRRKELTLVKKTRNLEHAVKVEEKHDAAVVEHESTINAKEKIIQIIKQLDSGSGASIDDIIVVSKLGNAEEIISDLIMRGEIFELKPGRIKLL